MYWRSDGYFVLVSIDGKCLRRIFESLAGLENRSKEALEWLRMTLIFELEPRWKTLSITPIQNPILERFLDPVWDPKSKKNPLRYQDWIWYDYRTSQTSIFVGCPYRNAYFWSSKESPREALGEPFWSEKSLWRTIKNLYRIRLALADALRQLTNRILGGQGPPRSI